MELRINDRIRTTTIKLFNKTRISLKYDSIADTFSFDYYFNPDNFAHKELSCIGHYHIAELWHNNELLLRGYVLSIAFNSSSVAQMVSVGGYSLSGVLEDCDIPVAIEGMTLDNTGLTLTQIASRYLQPFGIGLIVDGKLINEANEVTASQAFVNNSTAESTTAATNESNPATSVADLITPTSTIPTAPNPSNAASVAAANTTPDGVPDKYGIVITPWGNDSDTVTEKMDVSILTATAQIQQNIKSYLSKLASYQNIILSHDEYGNVVFTKAKINNHSTATFKKGVPGTTMSLSFNGQAMHSHIIATQQADATANAIPYMSTLRNPYVPYVFRPKVITVNQPIDGIDHTLEAAKNYLCNELRNLKVIITTDRWTFPNGSVIRPNHVITIQNDDIYLYKPSKWFIESVELEGDEKSETAKITCTLPSCYDYSQPTYLFQGINEH